MTRGVRSLLAVVALQCALLVVSVPIQLRADVFCSGDCRSGESAHCSCTGTGCQCNSNENHCWATCSSGQGCEDTNECEGPIEDEG